MGGRSSLPQATYAIIAPSCHIVAQTQQSRDVEHVTTAWFLFHAQHPPGQIIAYPGWDCCMRLRLFELVQGVADCSNLLCSVWGCDRANHASSLGCGDDFAAALCHQAWEI